MVPTILHPHEASSLVSFGALWADLQTSYESPNTKHQAHSFQIYTQALQKKPKNKHSSAHASLARPLHPILPPFTPQKKRPARRRTPWRSPSSPQALGCSSSSNHLAPCKRRKRSPPCGPAGRRTAELFVPVRLKNNLVSMSQERKWPNTTTSWRQHFQFEQFASWIPRGTSALLPPQPWRTKLQKNRTYAFSSMKLSYLHQAALAKW